MSLLNSGESLDTMFIFDLEAMFNSTRFSALNGEIKDSRDYAVLLLMIDFYFRYTITSILKGNRTRELFFCGAAVEKKILYFEKKGKDNTGACLDIVQIALGEGMFRHIVIATTTGSNGLLFSGALKGQGVNVVVVTHSAGFKGPNTFEISDESLRQMRSNGASVYTGTILTHSIETALNAQFSGIYPAMIIAQSLRRFGEGAKVCCEIVMMAADAGLIPEGEEVMAVAGTGYGADTVMLLKSAVSKRFLDLKVLEILAKPRG